LSSLFRMSEIRPKLSLDLRNKLVQEYREDINKLEDLIDRDLSVWMNTDFNGVGG